MASIAGSTTSPMVPPPGGRGGLARALPSRESWAGFIFVSPFVIGFVLFAALPMVASLVLSLTDFDPRRPDEIHFIGLTNYVRMASDPLVHASALVRCTVNDQLPDAWAVVRPPPPGVPMMESVLVSQAARETSNVRQRRVDLT